jgi:hypothetical protein
VPDPTREDQPDGEVAAAPPAQRKLDVFPGNRRRQRRYPWKLWMDGNSWEIERGVDFDQPIDDFRNRLYGKAADSGWEGCRTHHYVHALNVSAETLIDLGEISKATPVYDLNALIAGEKEPDARAVLEGRRERLRAEGRQVAHLVGIQFFGPPAP